MEFEIVWFCGGRGRAIIKEDNVDRAVDKAMDMIPSKWVHPCNWHEVATPAGCKVWYMNFYNEDPVRFRTRKIVGVIRFVDVNGIMPPFRHRGYKPPIDLKIKDPVGMLKKNAKEKE
jgi:hypothetical protein